MRPFFFTLLMSIFGAVFFSACSTSRAPIPVGEIPRARALTASEEAYGHQVFVQLSRRYTVDYNDPRLDRITKIVNRLTHAAGADQIPWHVYLFRAAEVKNAGATRGNHVFVWSGLLDFVRDDDELATIIGHELAHVLAGHTDPDPNEEVKKMLISIGSLAAGVAVSAATGASVGVDLGQVTSAVTEQVGNGLLVNPYSRELEREADQIGLFLMADAGYNPEAAISFWTRANGSADFQSGPAFLSTHPDTAERLSHLRELLPQAKARFGQSGSYGSTAPSTYYGSSNYVSTLKSPTSKGLDSYYADRYGYGAPSTSSTSGTREHVPASPSASSSSSTSDRGDSFDWGGSSGGSSKGDKGQKERPAKTTALQTVQKKAATYTVAASRAIVYADSSTRERPLGEFRRGARVEGRVVNKFWLEIMRPDHGFIKLEDLAPAS